VRNPQFPSDTGRTDRASEVTRLAPGPLVDAFETLAARRALPADAASELDRRGFVVLRGAIPTEDLARLTVAYDAAMASASAPDLRVGSTSTRLSDFVNRGPEFDALYVFPPLIDACCRVIGRPFKLSCLHARTLRPHTSAEELHVDLQRDSADWPLVGFILMLDAFGHENGATRFVPGSHEWSSAPNDDPPNSRAACANPVLACGPAGSLLIFNGSTWHGHAANTSDNPRRSLQGAFIPRDGRAATEFSTHMQPETRARLSALARSVLTA
jgi:hypothetical protein